MTSTKIRIRRDVFTSIALWERVQDQTIVVNGFPRLLNDGCDRYAAGSAEIMAAMDKIQTQNVSNPVSFCQKAAVEALNVLRLVDKMIANLTGAGNHRSTPQRHAGITCSFLKGVLVFPNVPDYSERNGRQEDCEFVGRD